MVVIDLETKGKNCLSFVVIRNYDTFPALSTDTNCLG